jgi:hypothetical protein
MPAGSPGETGNAASTVGAGTAAWPLSAIRALPTASIAAPGTAARSTSGCATVPNATTGRLTDRLSPV